MINEIQNSKIGNHSLPAQRQTVLDALEKAPRTTIELREQFDIISPPARIFELKARGYIIIKTNVTATTAQGRTHKKIARYFLISEGK